MNKVLISGGGPAGLLLAGELALAGVPVTVFERRAEPASVSQGMAVHGRTLELFALRGLTDVIKPEDMFPWPLTPFALMWLDMTDAPPQDYTYAFPQWRTERLLEDWAVGLGADVRRGHEVVAVAQDEDGVTVQVQDGSGRRHEVTGDWLAACDGAESRVRELAGIGFRQVGPGYYGVMGDMRLSDDADRQFDAGLHAGGMFGAIPLDGQTVRLMTIEFDVPKPPDDVAADPAELAARITRITGRTPNLGALSWVSRFGAPTRLADTFRSGRVFLVGDAAHSLFISGTQGLNAALHDAANLGWKLAATVHGWAPPDLLDSYEAERRPVAEGICAHATATTALLHPLEKVEKLRDLVQTLFGFEDGNRHLLEVTTRARYPLPADPASGHPLLGRPVPAATLTRADGESPVADTLRAARGVLLDLSEGTARLDAAAGWADRVTTVTAKPTPDLPAAVLLLRPDGHIAHADPDGTDTAGLLEGLRTWFGPPTA